MLWHADPAVLRDRAGGNRKPLISLTVGPEDDETEVLGKYVEDLQSGVSVEGNKIVGTLNYVTGYTGFSGDPTLQEGNYLVLKFDTDDEDDVITVELTNGVTGHPVALDSDRNMVIRVTDPRKQKLKVVVEHMNEDETVIERKESYDLRLLELLPKTGG